MNEGPANVTRAYIAVGSNIDPDRNILDALALLAARVSVVAVSTFYRGEALAPPEGQPVVPSQPPFFNGACAVDTGCSARALKFDILRPIEGQCGRKRTEDKWAARTIDLDIVLFGEQVMDEPGLRIPDPDLRRRPFLAVPLWELAPHAVMPDTGEALVSILDHMNTNTLLSLPEFTDKVRTRLGL